jgi:UDP-glucose 4-epimerase
VYDLSPRPAAFSCAEYIQGVIEETERLRQALLGVEVVFHLIGTTHPKTSNDDPVYDVESNVVGTLRILDTCVTVGVRRFVFNSSGGTVYGIPRSLPISEDHPTDPTCSYGITKLTIEKYLYLYHHLYGLDYIVLRTANAYGPGQHPGRGQGVVATFLERVARGQPIEVWGDGSVIRDYIHVDDVARALLMVAEQRPCDRVLNVGSGMGTALIDLIHLIRKVTGRDFEVRYAPGRPFDVPAVVLDTRRIQEQISWKPRMKLNDGLHSTWEWLQNWVG